MCEQSNFDGHKVLVCTVGDLKAGDRYRTPDGRELLVLGIQPNLDGHTQVANVSTGEVFNHDNATKLGRDRAGRLFASRSLNPTPPPAPATVEVPTAVSAT